MKTLCTFSDSEDGFQGAPSLNTHFHSLRVALKMSDTVEDFVSSSAAPLCTYMLNHADDKTGLLVKEGMSSCTQCAEQYGICTVPMQKSDQTGEFSIDADGWFLLRHKDGKMWYKGMAYDSMVLGFNVEKSTSEKGHCMQQPAPSMFMHILLSTILLVADYFLPTSLGWSKGFCNLAFMGGAFVVGFSTFYFLFSLAEGEYINPYLTSVLHLIAWAPITALKLLQGHLYVWAGFLTVALLSFIVWRQRKWVLFGTIQAVDVYLLLRLCRLLPQASDPYQHRLILSVTVSLVVGFFSTFLSMRTSRSTWRFDDWSPLLLNLSGFAATFVLLLCYFSIAFFYQLSETYGMIAVLTLVTAVIMLAIACWKKLIDYGWLSSFMGVGNDVNVLCTCMILIPGFYVDCVTVILMDWELWVGLVYTLGLTIVCLFLGWSICDAFRWSSDLISCITILATHLAVAAILLYVQSLMWKLIALGFLVGCGFISCLVLCCCSN